MEDLNCMFRYYAYAKAQRFNDNCDNHLQIAVCSYSVWAFIVMQHVAIGWGELQTSIAGQYSNEG